LREGLSRRTRAAGILAALGALALAIGASVTTAGEHGQRVVKALVQAVVDEDVAGGLAMFADDALMNAGSPQNPGFDVQVIRSRFARLADNYTIHSNTITEMSGYSVSSDVAEVHLGCRTTVEGFPTISRWVVLVKRDAQGEWKVSRLTCVSINNQTVPIDSAW